jgi:hypothetical protein
MKFKDLKPVEKRKLLKQEYLRDGAEESYVNELVPADQKFVDLRLTQVFGYEPLTEVEL